MSRYIDQDKVLEYIIFGVVGKDITCGELKRAIESLPAIEVSEKTDDWIPISKGLPTKYEVNKDNRFLVTLNNNLVHIYTFDYDGTSDEYWKRNVVAWKPLPKPYNKGEDE